MMADSRVENGPDSRQHIWDCEGKGSQMVLGAEVSLWSKAITWSPEVNADLMEGADRLAPPLSVVVGFLASGAALWSRGACCSRLQLASCQKPSALLA